MYENDLGSKSDPSESKSLSLDARRLSSADEYPQIEVASLSTGLGISPNDIDLDSLGKGSPGGTPRRSRLTVQQQQQGNRRFSTGSAGSGRHMRDSVL